ncbi:hypothetical protein bcgnr5411_53840 [Bacillus cereus]
MKEFAIPSNGSKYGSPKWLRKSEKRLVFLKHSLSCKKEDSAKRDKAMIQVARLHEKIANQYNG